MDIDLWGERKIKVVPGRANPPSLYMFVSRRLLEDGIMPIITGRVILLVYFYQFSCHFSYMYTHKLRNIVLPAIRSPLNPPIWHIKLTITRHNSALLNDKESDSRMGILTIDLVLHQYNPCILGALRRVRMSWLYQISKHSWFFSLPVIS